MKSTDCRRIEKGSIEAMIEKAYVELGEGHAAQRRHMS